MRMRLLLANKIRRFTFVLKGVLVIWLVHCSSYLHLPVCVRVHAVASPLGWARANFLKPLSCLPV